MPSQLPIADITAALQQRLFPPSRPGTGWKPGRAHRTFNVRSQAEVRDALWMLTKQWQMGEFRGSDAGSPVFAKLLMSTTRLTKFRPAAGPSNPSTLRFHWSRKSNVGPCRSTERNALSPWTSAS